MAHYNVIGAAIAGPAAALQLARMGHTVTVHEAKPEADLVSAGILGITHGNWNVLLAHQADMGAWELPNNFRDYASAQTVQSPFRYITWTGLHTALCDAARAAGVAFRYGHHVTPGTMPGNVVEATGVAGAAGKLRHRYSGTTIYRGLSPDFIGESFIAYRETPGQYLTIGDTPDGAFWAYFLARPGIHELRTVELKHAPREYLNLPREFHHVITDTPVVNRSPISNWRVPPVMMNGAGTRITVGDVNGPIRPVTTSGANLAVMEGFSVAELLNPATSAKAQADMLARRAFDLQLGRQLDGPEIGGTAEDVRYYQHHMMLFTGASA